MTVEGPAEYWRVMPERGVGFLHVISYVSAGRGRVHVVSQLNAKVVRAGMGVILVRVWIGAHCAACAVEFRRVKGIFLGEPGIPMPHATERTGLEISAVERRAGPRVGMRVKIKAIQHVVDGSAVNPQTNRIQASVRAD